MAVVALLFLIVAILIKRKNGKTSIKLDAAGGWSGASNKDIDGMRSDARKAAHRLASYIGVPVERRGT